MSGTFHYTAAVYALISAFLFALTNHLQSIGLRGADARSGALVNIATGAVMYWLLSPLYLESWFWLTSACALFALVGLFRPSLSSAMALSSIHYMGPTLSSALTACAPIFGAAYAILLLGEQLRQQIPVTRMVPEMMMRIDDGEPRLDNLFLVRSKPVWSNRDVAAGIQGLRAHLWAPVQIFDAKHTS